MRLKSSAAVAVQLEAQSAGSGAIDALLEWQWRSSTTRGLQHSGQGEIRTAQGRLQASNTGAPLQLR